MRPNWLLLGYLLTVTVVLAGTVVIASLALINRLTKALAYTSVWDLDGLLLITATVGLGVLPWPGLAVLARALLKPDKPIGSVDQRPVGKSVVVLVALNEEQAIEKVVAEFAAQTDVGSVIVVDNGSSDRTADLAVRAGATVIREENRGYGFACRRALAEGVRSGHPVVILCEADSTFRATDVEKLIAYLRHSDLAIGSRTHLALLNGDSQLDSFFVLGNVFIGKILQFRYWDWTVGGKVRLTDVGCTFMGFHAEPLSRILPSLDVGGNHFVPHLLMVALEHGMSVIQVPITFWRRLGTSKGGNASWSKGFRLGLTMIWHILTHRVKAAAHASSFPGHPRLVQP